MHPLAYPLYSALIEAETHNVCDKILVVCYRHLPVALSAHVKA